MNEEQFFNMDVHIKCNLLFFEINKIKTFKEEYKLFTHEIVKKISRI